MFGMGTRVALTPRGEKEVDGNMGQTSGPKWDIMNVLYDRKEEDVESLAAATQMEYDKLTKYLGNLRAKGLIVVSE